MNISQKVFIAVSLFLPLASAVAGPLIYTVSAPPIGSGQFGTVDLATGAFSRIGGDIPGTQGLAPTPDGSLLTLTFAGDLARIDPATGAFTVIGATGLADCANPPVSPCGPQSANSIAVLGNQVYVTDLANDLYKVDSTTGKATLVGATGIQAVPFTPVAPMDADGTFGFYDEGLFGANGNLYTTFDAGTFDPTTFVQTVVIAPKLYRIDPLTGLATTIGDTEFGLGAVTAGAPHYAFNGVLSTIVTLDLSTGNALSVSSFDPAIGIVTGASTATPEPDSLTLAGVALLLVFQRSLGMQRKSAGGR